MCNSRGSVYARAFRVIETLVLPSALISRSVAGTSFEGSSDVGVYARLTNSYCVVALGGASGFYSVFESELADHIPVIHASIAGCRFVGRVTTGAWLMAMARVSEMEVVQCIQAVEGKVLDGSVDMPIRHCRCWDFSRALLAKCLVTVAAGW